MAIQPASTMGQGAHQHPSTLTCTERPRFIRSSYTLWGMMKLNDAFKWRSKLESMILKQSFHSQNDSIDAKHRVRAKSPFHYSLISNEVSDFVHFINTGRCQERLAFSDQVWQQIQNISQRVFSSKHARFKPLCQAWGIHVVRCILRSLTRIPEGLGLPSIHYKCRAQTEPGTGDAIPLGR